jgi:hypothetical protein
MSKFRVSCVQFISSKVGMRARDKFGELNAQFASTETWMRIRDKFKDHQ